MNDRAAPPSPSPAQRHQSLALLAILAASLALRLVFATISSGPVLWDAANFDALARSLLHSGTFPSALRTPGYPAFVAVVCALYRLSPGVAIYAGWLLREAWLVLLVPLAAWLALLMVSRDWRLALPLGLAQGAIAYVRTEATLLAAFILLVALLRSTWRRRALGGGALAAGIALAGMSPWLIHCRLHRGYLGMDAGLGPNLLSRTWHFAPDGAVEPEFREHIKATVAAANLTEQEKRDWMVADRLIIELPKGDVRAEAGLYHRLLAISLENIRRHPLAFLRTLPFDLARTMGGEPFRLWKEPWHAPIRECWRDRLWGHLSLKVLNYAIWPAVVGSSALVGLWWSLRRRDGSAWPIAATMIACAGCILTMTVLATKGEPRYRVPYDAVLYTASVLGFAAISSRSSVRSRSNSQRFRQSPPP